MLYNDVGGNNPNDSERSTAATVTVTKCNPAAALLDPPVTIARADGLLG